MTEVKRDYKSRMFTMIFSDKKELLSLYNAVASQNLYGEKLIKIPTPQFIVLYNGVKKRPEREMLRLSDAYMTDEQNVALELTVVVVNVNVGYNEDIKKTCKTLNDYVIFVQKVRDYMMSGMTIEESVDIAIEECIREDILREFLVKNRAEARAVSIYEYNQEEHLRMEREQSFADGYENGFKEGIEKIARRMHGKGKTLEEIADLLGKEISEVEKY